MRRVRVVRDYNPYWCFGRVGMMDASIADVLSARGFVEYLDVTKPLKATAKTVTKGER